MNNPPYPSTPKQAHAWFVTHGICIADWCKEQGFNRFTVFDLLRGKRKGVRGEAHKAAVALGLKADPKTASQPVAA
ncbi:DNA-binding protein [Pseudomonas sp. o96-267]|uniref:DNA-binding protein n=1 Tax=Pseudomonas sp. o96-267 TaxID=2479853 RepID=UPI000F76C9EE|nr:DNA-binding protein [Pseudomonas sp. o96-267]RRV28623.1 DNA-binding protein [Pseudomonas sp. o96-267]